jgi:hypothetical protein
VSEAIENEKKEIVFAQRSNLNMDTIESQKDPVTDYRGRHDSTTTKGKTSKEQISIAEDNEEDEKETPSKEDLL